MVNVLRRALAGIAVAIATVVGTARCTHFTACGSSNDVCTDTFYRHIENWIVEHQAFVLVAAVAYAIAVLLLFPRETAGALRAPFRARFFAELIVWVAAFALLLGLTVHYPEIREFTRLPWWPR